MAAKFTVRQLMEATRAVALERPDHIANPGGEDLCRYFHTYDGTPDCVVGHAFARLGVTYKDVKGSNTIKISVMLDALGVEGDDMGWLSDVQHEQDCGRSWSEAVRFADGEVPQ